jgi:tetratricopeptide (TPR) repeat protein
LRNIAETYIECPNKSLDDAIALLTTAIKIDPKNEDAHLFMGDALLAKTPENGSESIKYYNEVLKINPKSPTGLVRIGNLYRQARSFSAANEKYIEAISIDSTYAPAYRESAELYFQYDKAESAIKNWEKYLSLNNGNEARYRYATSLFIANKFCAAITEIENLQAKNFNNYYMERILAYCYYECSKTGNMEASLSSSSGLKALDRYFAIVPKDKIIYQDYKYKGLLLTLSGSDSLAILELEKGYELNPESHEILSEIAKLQFKAKKFNDAIVTFNKKKTLVGLTVLEYYDLGRAYYFGPKNYAAADSAFASLIEFSDSYYPAYLWRARNMYYLDTVESNYSQKPYYEKVYELITKDDKNSKFGKTAFIESARYLGRLYSFESSPFKDIEKAKNCWNAILELDPADVESLTFFKENPN